MGAGMSLVRDDKDLWSCDSATQTLCGPYTADIQSLNSKYTEVVQIGKCQMLDENHANGSETGPYGSVRAHIHTGWIPQALGSLWDASRALKPFGKSKNPGFPGSPLFSNIFLYFPIIPQQQQACRGGMRCCG